MKVIYTISDDYMDAWLQETEDFSFSILGYSSITRANRNLIKANASDIIGFVYNNDNISEEDYDNLCDFIDRVLLLNKHFTFIFICKNKQMLSRLGDEFRRSDISLKCIYEYEYIDNILIREAITCLLRDVYTPYSFDSKEEIVDTKDYIFDLNYTTLFPKYMDRVMEPIDFNLTAQDTIARDSLLIELEDLDLYKNLHFLRSSLIRAHFGEASDFSKFRFNTGNNVVDAVTLCVKSEIDKLLLINNKEV